MPSSLHKQFSQLADRKVPEGLFRSIMAKIEARQKRKAQLRFGFFGIVFLAAAGVFIPVLYSLHNAMSESGSYQFASLIFSNFSQVASSWQDFAFSVMETLPISSIVSFLAVVFFILASLRFMARDGKTLFYRYFHHF